jgi:polynucleotide 5'-kinase involved in rRNA processing
MLARSVALCLARFSVGERGGPLERYPGPEKWQAEVLAYIRDNVGIGRPLRVAIAGGVGPGKSALMAWIVN